MSRPRPQQPPTNLSLLRRFPWRRFPWWLYVLVLLCACGGIANLVNPPKGTSTGTTTGASNQAATAAPKSADTSESIAAEVVGTLTAPAAAAAPVPTDTPAPVQGQAAPTDPPKPSDPTAKGKGLLINLSALLGHPRGEVEAALGKPLSEAAGVTAPSIFNADFTGTALEYKVAPYTATVYLDKGKVARGVVLDVASVYDLGGEEYSTAPLDPSEGPAAYLAHLGLPMPVETPEGGNLSDRPAGDFKTLQWKHTADGYWIYIRALRSGRITGLNAWKLGGVAATQVVQVPPTTTNLAKKPTTAPTAKPLAAKPTNAPAKPSGLKYDPNGPDRNCSDFDTYQEALAFYRAAGGPARDPHGLDNDHDGIPCENLPSAP